MNKKKKSKKKATKALPRLSAGEETLLNSILSEIDHIDSNNIQERINSPGLARVLIGRLPLNDESSVKALLAINNAFDDKDVKKAVKKAVFKLRRKGLPVPDLEEEKGLSLTLGRSEAEEPSAYVGPIDGSGRRGILVTLPLTFGGVDVGIGVTSSEQGITYFIYDRCSKKHSRDLKESFFQYAEKPVETSFSHAATLLERAYGKSKLSRGEEIDNYLKLRPRVLENASLLDRSPVHDFIRSEDLSGDYLNQTAMERLLGHELMEIWVMPPDETQNVLEEIMGVEDSPIIVTEDQKENRINEIKEKAVKDLFPHERRLRLKEDLEEMAYVFYKLGDGEIARMSLAASSSLGEEDSFMGGNPFLKALLEHSLDFYTEIMQENDESEARDNAPSSHIITP